MLGYLVSPHAKSSCWDVEESTAPAKTGEAAAEAAEAAEAAAVASTSCCQREYFSRTGSSTMTAKMAVIAIVAVFHVPV